MRILTLKEDKSPAQGYSASKWRNEVHIHVCLVPAGFSVPAPSSLPTRYCPEPSVCSPDALAEHLSITSYRKPFSYSKHCILSVMKRPIPGDYCLDLIRENWCLSLNRGQRSPNESTQAKSWPPPGFVQPSSWECFVLFSIFQRFETNEK